MSHPQIKLTYFNGTGRAELTRLLLVASGIQFEDERLQGPEFAALKPQLPLGQLPVVTVDGSVFPQSMAIARYAARLGGLYPTDALQTLKVESALESLIDAINAFIDIKFRTPDEAAKAEKTTKFVQTTLPAVFGYIEKQFAGKFFLGDKMGIVDLSLFDFITNGITAASIQFDVTKFPKIKGAIDAVKADAKIAAYLAKTH
ncbi:hypothetical protein PINS_up001777 [Pythium insidiosum]|nr:hypothetical protein PINS_up001777 [Pythium insidiosum]